MALPPPGAIAVVFVSLRSMSDDRGYAATADAMHRRAASMRGYLGIDAARGSDRLGITVSWWADAAAAIAWRDDPVHAAIRERGRAVWYDWYRVVVCRAERAYEWTRVTPASPA